MRCSPGAKDQIVIVVDCSNQEAGHPRDLTRQQWTRTQDFYQPVEALANGGWGRCC